MATRSEPTSVLGFVANMMTEQIGVLDFVTNMATQSEQIGVLDFVTSTATQSQQIDVLDFVTNTATQSEQIGVFAFVTNMVTYSKPTGRWEFDVPFRDTHGKRTRHVNLQIQTDLATNMATVRTDQHVRFQFGMGTWNIFLTNTVTVNNRFFVLFFGRQN